MVTVSKLEQRGKKKKKERRKGTLHILEQEGGGDLALRKEVYRYKL